MRTEASAGTAARGRLGSAALDGYRISYSISKASQLYEAKDTTHELVNTRRSVAA